MRWLLTLILVSSITSSNANNCTDTSLNCAELRHLCDDLEQGPSIQVNCQETCNKCLNVEQINRKRRNERCVDHKNCKSRSNRNVCSTKNRSQCPRMCNLCKSRNNNNGNSNGVTTPYSVWFNSLDERADPCQDFYQFTCGKYLRNNKPKTANEVNSPLTDIAKNVAKQKLALILDNSETGSTAIRKLRQYRDSCKNQTAVDAERTKSLRRDINSLGGCPMLVGPSWKPRNFDLTNALIGFSNFSTDEFIVNIVPDKMTDNNVYMRFSPAQLIVKVPQIYNETRAELKIQQLEDFLINLMNIVASDMKSAQSYATISKAIKEVIALDKQFAGVLNIAWPVPNDPDEFEVKAKRIKLSELKKIFPLIDWKRYLNESARFPNKARSYLSKDPHIYIHTIELFKQLNAIISKTKKHVVANYLFTRYVVSSIPYLDSRFADAGRRFAEQLDGFKRTPNRDQDCLATIESNFPLVIDHLFIQKHFDSKSREDVNQMVEDLRYGLSEIISAEKWMQESTKAYAIKKLKKTKKIVAGVLDAIDQKRLDQRYSYVKFNVPEDSYRQMARKVIINNARRLFMNVIRPELYTFVETMRTTETNAINVPDENVIFIASAMAQAPVFDASMPASMNYGGLGFIIGHEYTHSLDNDGSKYDETGKKLNWWDKDSKAEFQARSNCFVKQYGRLKEKDMKRRVNGNQTLGENIADNGGIKAAFKAYQRHLRTKKDKPVPGYSKYTNEQSLFISMGVTFCQSAGQSHRAFLLDADNHSPSIFRINTILSNFPEFAKAFKCRQNTPMNPTNSNRCSIW